MASISTFEQTKITVKGLQLLTKIMLTGGSLKLTRVAIGEGVPIDDPSSLTGLIKEIPSHKTGEEGTSAIVDLQTLAAADETTAIIRISIQNGDTAFVLREIGIYAQEPNGDEILYAYTCDRSDYAMPFPSNTDGLYLSETTDILFFISSIQNIDANITLPAEVSHIEFSAHKSAAVLDHPDGSVTSRKIADNAITQSKLSNDCVAQSKIKDDAVTKNKIGDGAVTNKKIENGAVTLEKLASELYTYSRKPVRVGTWVDGKPVWRVAIPITPLSAAGITKDKNTIDISTLLDNIHVTKTAANMIYLDSMLKFQSRDGSYAFWVSAYDDKIKESGVPGIYDVEWGSDSTATSIYGWVEFALDEKFFFVQEVI